MRRLRRFAPRPPGSPKGAAFLVVMEYDERGRSRRMWAGRDLKHLVCASGD
jgi:hypothetical protein